MLKWTPVLLLGVAGFWFLRPSSPKPVPVKAVASVPATKAPSGDKGFLVDSASRTPLPNSDRVYFIVSSGVHSKKQLVRAMSTDPVVARQYAHFNLARFHLVRLRRGFNAYVSYRIGDMSFWTNRKIRIYAGETLITDGTHYGRSRCGNQISRVPRKPTSTWQPSEEQLGAPDVPIVPTSLRLPPSVHFSLRPPPPTGTGFFPPLVPPVYLPPGGPRPPKPTTPVPPVPVSVPEPGTLLLLSSALAVLGLRQLWNALQR